MCLKPTLQQTCSGGNLGASWKTEVAQLRLAQARSRHCQGEWIHFNAARYNMFFVFAKA